MKKSFTADKKEKTVKNRQKHKLGLALSGGGTRGFAHVGVFRALTECGIVVDCVAGTSAGSLFGAAYCLGLDSEKVAEFCHTVSNKDITGGKWLKFGYDTEKLENLTDKLFGGATFDDVKIPFRCVAVDLVSGQEAVLHSGSLAKACSASCAVPVVFKPVKTDGMVLVDGGVLNNIPADVCRKLGAEVVVSVDLNHTRGEGTTSPKFLDQLAATWRILNKSASLKGQLNSDLVIEPELRIFKNTSIGDIDAMIEEGYRATMAKMDDIKELLGLKK